AGDFDGLADSGHPPLAIISALLRSMLIASPGHRLVAADFSQIEARVLAWIAEQDDLVEMFRVGGKIYEDMAAFMQTRKLGRPVTAAEIEEDSVERQLGKNTVLGCGFQMGWE